MRSAIVIPTYNESDNIPDLVRQVSANVPDLHVIIVDDNSPDGTGRLANELAHADNRVHPIHRPAKLGLGTAQIAGMKFALNANAEIVLTMDADFSHSPLYLPDLIRAVSAQDLVIGSRYVHGGGTRFCSIKRQVLSLGANALARTALGLKAHDCTAGFRAYRRAVLESIDLDAIVSDGYSFLIEMLYRCQQGGWRISEVPIIFEDRRHGKSKVSRQEIWKALNTVLRLRVESGHLSKLPFARRTIP